MTCWENELTAVSEMVATQLQYHNGNRYYLHAAQSARGKTYDGLVVFFSNFQKQKLFFGFIVSIFNIVHVVDAIHDLC